MHDVELVRIAASTRWPEIVANLGSIDGSILDGKHNPCPKCGGRDRFRFFSDDTGGAICNQCFTSRNGDGFAVLQWLNGWKFTEAVQRVADYLGIDAKATRRTGKPKPDEHLVFRDWDDTLIALWCQRKRPITPDAVRAFHGQLASYRGQYVVVAFPIHGPKDETVGWAMYNVTGGTLPKYGRDNETEWVKVKVTHGSASGLVGPVDRIGNAATIWKLEGLTDALAVQSIVPAGGDVVAITNANGAKERPADWMAARVAQKTVNVCHDCDKPGQDGATWVGEPDGRQRPGWAPALASQAAVCRNVVLPYSVVADHGQDVRDWLLENHTWDDLAALADASEVFRPPTEEQKKIVEESDDDPHRLARVNMSRYAAAKRGATIRHWRGEWYLWKGNRYQKIQQDELAAKINWSIKQEFDRLNLDGDDDKPARKVTKNIVGNVLEATKGMTIISSRVELGTWVDGETRDRRSYISLSNGLLDLDALFSDQDDILLPHSPNWFSTVCLPYPFDPDARCRQWLDVLAYNMEGDQERMDLLQEWAGYLLTPDTGMQKFLMCEGEGANGKSVYLAVLESMLGEENCSHVPFETFGDRFSRAQTLGKLLNLSADIGELDKVAEGQLKSFVAGEKMFFDRKGISGIEAYPTARLMVACNVRPRVADKSKGVFRRMILVPFNREIPASKAILNMDKPWWWERSGELPGILNWAIAGLDRLRRNGAFTDPEICRRAMDDYREENNPARQFISERTEQLDAAYVVCAELYDRYKRWCVDNGFHPLSSRGFGRELHRCHPQVERVRISEGGIRVYAYFNLKLAGE